MERIVSFRQGDRVLFLLCLLSSLYGLLLIFSATRYDPTLHGLVEKQAVALLIGVAAFFLLTVLDLDALLERFWKILPAINLLLLLLLIPFGNDNGTGNKSWISLPGGLFHFQPAEVVKLTFVLLLSLQFCKLKERNARQFSALIQTAGHTLLLCGLIYAVSGDMGMVLVYLLIYLVVAWSAGISPLWLLLGVCGAGGVGAILWPRLPEYVRMRFLVVFHHDLDPLGKGFQQSRSLLAIGSGQVSGQGYLRGTQTQSASSASLPARHTDFIFSVAGEELGLLGCLVLLFLLGALVLRCIFLAKEGGASLHALAAMGFAGMLGVQVILNMGMCLFVAPVVGITLPFFSYGGSSLITNCVAMGILSGFRRQGLRV